MEEGLDVVRLQPARLGTLHVFADAAHAARVHGIVGQRPFIEQVLQMAAVQRVFEDALHGLATGFGDAGGFALFKTADGSVKTIGAGGTSSDGWRLASIHPDHVILEREGASVRLDLAARQHLTAEQGE